MYLRQTSNETEPSLRLKTEQANLLVGTTSLFFPISWFNSPLPKVEDNTRFGFFLLTHLLQKNFFTVQ